MFQDMYNYGRIPYQQDVNNWNIENTNRDIRYLNDLSNYKNSMSGLSGFSQSLGNGITGAFQGYMQTKNPWGAAAGGLGGLLGGRM